jgi:hypothetical protein
VTCQWHDYDPIRIQLASPNTVADLMDTSRQPSIAMDFDRAYSGDQGIRRALIHGTSSQILEVRTQPSLDSQDLTKVLSVQSQYASCHCYLYRHGAHVLHMPQKEIALRF